MRGFKSNINRIKPNINAAVDPYIKNYLTTLKLIDYNELKKPLGVNLNEVINSNTLWVPVAPISEENITNNIKKVVLGELNPLNQREFIWYTPQIIEDYSAIQAIDATEKISNFEPVIKQVMSDKISAAQTEIITDELWADLVYSFNKVKVLSSITQDKKLFGRAASVINWLETISEVTSPLNKIKISNEMIQ